MAVLSSTQRKWCRDAQAACGTFEFIDGEAKHMSSPTGDDLFVQDGMRIYFDVPVGMNGAPAGLLTPACGPSRR